MIKYFIWRRKMDHGFLGRISNLIETFISSELYTCSHRKSLPEPCAHAERDLTKSYNHPNQRTGISQKAKICNNELKETLHK